MTRRKGIVFVPGRQSGRQTREAAMRSVKAARLERRGLTAAMWEMIAKVHLARLKPERGLVASGYDLCLGGLYRRGVVAYEPLDGGAPVPEEGQENRGIWTLTDVGRALAMVGPEGDNEA